MPSKDYDHDAVERRLDAVKRALAEDGLTQGAGLPDRLDRLEELDSRVAELEAAVQALRGYGGSVRAVNEDIERRADRAFRKAESVERNVGSPASGVNAADG